MEDPYVIEGSNPPVLKNKLGIQDLNLLQEAQKEICFQKLCLLRLDAVAAFQKEGLLDTDTISFGAEHLRRIHYYLFHDIFPFAGKYRTIDLISQGRPPAPASFVTSFMSHYEIERELEMTLSIMARSIGHKKFQNKDEYAEWLSSYFRTVIHIHPFRDGNGRALKEYFSEFVEYSNSMIHLDPVEISWEHMPSEECSNIIYMETLEPDYLDHVMKQCLVYKQEKVK